MAADHLSNAHLSDLSKTSPAGSTVKHPYKAILLLQCMTIYHEYYNAKGQPFLLETYDIPSLSLTMQAELDAKGDMTGARTLFDSEGSLIAIHNRSASTPSAIALNGKPAFDAQNGTLKHHNTPLNQFISCHASDDKNTLAYTWTQRTAQRKKEENLALLQNDLLALTFSKEASFNKPEITSVFIGCFSHHTDIGPYDVPESGRMEKLPNILATPICSLYFTIDTDKSGSINRTPDEITDYAAQEHTPLDALNDMLAINSDDIFVQRSYIPKDVIALDLSVGHYIGTDHYLAMARDAVTQRNSNPMRQHPHYA